MLSKVVVLALVGIASCAVIDDGSYDAQRYELPYVDEVSENTRSARTYSAPAAANYLQQPAARAPARSAYTADARNAQILSEARYLQADGKFGASYTQEDGVQFKEESDADGTRRGSYSWVDPTGERRTVSYVAGKFGFQASGEHLPEQPPLVVAQEPEQSRYVQNQGQSRYVVAQPQYQPEPVPQSRYVQPQPQYQAQQPQYVPQQQAQPQYVAQPQPQQYVAPKPQVQQYVAPQPQVQQYVAPQPQPAYRPRPQYRVAEQPAVQSVGDIGLGPAHPTITQSTADSYSISAAF